MLNYRHMYRILARKPLRNKSLRRLQNDGDNVTTDISKEGLRLHELIEAAEDPAQWHAIVL